MRIHFRKNISSKRHFRFYRKGQSLVEIVVAVGVVALLVTGLIVATTAAVKTSRIAQMRSAANKYAQEGVELMRNLRDSGWLSFQALDTGAIPGGDLYCLGDDNTLAVSGSNCAAGTCVPNVSGLYTRSVCLTWDDGSGTPPPRMEATVIVNWTDGNTAHTSQLNTYFTQWR